MVVEDVFDSPRGGETSTTALDMDRPDATTYTALVTELRGHVDGGVKFDKYAQVLYATDSGVYQA